MYITGCRKDWMQMQLLHMNVGKKVTGKKVTEKKSQIWVGKKVTKIKSFVFCFMLEIIIRDIIISIITNII